MVQIRSTEILGIDPGRNTGWAKLDENGTLQACGLGDPPLVSGCLVVLERPQVYPTTPSKQANDLITLAIGVGQYMERFRANEILLVLPHLWKGTVPKPIHNRRVLAKLTANERATYETHIDEVAEGFRNNVIDAIGLAKYALSARRRPILQNR